MGAYNMEYGMSWYPVYKLISKENLKRLQEKYPFIRGKRKGSQNKAVSGKRDIGMDKEELEKFMQEIPSPRGNYRV
jgi:hypothetical protein